MLNDLYFDIGFIMFLNYNRIDLIWIDRGDAMNFREVNKKLNELKQSGNKQALNQFRNTKISEINFK